MQKSHKNVHTLLCMVKYIKQNTVSYIIGLLGLSITNSLVPIVLAFGMKDIISYAIEGKYNMLSKSIIIITTGMCILSLMFVAFSYLFRASTRKTMAHIRIYLFERIQSFPLSFFHTTHSGDIVSRMNNDLYLMEMAYSGHLRNVITSVMIGLYSSVTMIYFDWHISIILIFFAFIVTIINSKFSVIIKKIAGNIQAKNSEITKFAIEIFNALNCLKMFPCECLILNKFNKINDDTAKLNLQAAKTGAIYNSVNIFLHWINFSTLLFGGALLAMNGLIKLGVVVAIMQLYSGVSQMFNSLGNMVIQLQNSIAGAERIIELMDMEIETESCEMEDNGIDNSGIEIKGVKFGYDKENIIIHNLNLLIEKNKVVAIVGPSGSGKTSIIKILLGFYPVMEGEITVAGIKYAGNNISYIRDLIAYVPQDPFLFNTTIMENIAYGMENATEAEVTEAARKAQIHDYINSLPEKYNTMVGEKGIQLSGGQRQRIAIARALLKNSLVILFDEATSALDSESEDRIQKDIYENMSGKAVLVITHRLSTIKNSDYIYFMKEGCIAEEGTHTDLISKRGLYWNYCNYQFKESASI